MRNHHQCPVGTTTVQRVKKRRMMLNHPRMLIHSRKARKIITSRTNLKTKVQGKERNPSSATAVVVLIILQRSAKYSNTWLTCTRNPSRRQKRLKDHMKLTSTLHPMRLQLRAMRPDEVAKPNPLTDDYIGGENIIVEYNSNDMFGDQEYAPFILLDFINLSSM
jgi:hypothetical protein